MAASETVLIFLSFFVRNLGIKLFFQAITSSTVRESARVFNERSIVGYFFHSNASCSPIIFLTRSSMVLILLNFPIKTRFRDEQMVYMLKNLQLNPGRSYYYFTLFCGLRPNNANIFNRD